MTTPSKQQRSIESPWSRGEFSVCIGSLDDPSVTVFAAYRPPELQINKNVPWVPHTNKGGDGKLQLEFSGAQGRNVTLELFFDATEFEGDGLEQVRKSIDDLMTLASVREPGSKERTKQRPHHCVLVFGQAHTAFKCVITALAVKYTMFSPTGIPLRATANVTLTEARLVNQREDEALDKKLDEQREATLKRLEKERREDAEESEVDMVTIVQTLMHTARRIQKMHDLGWVHRDVKPSNVLRVPRLHTWTLIDFGSAARVGALL
ncbi:MAG: hypothetical protein HC863_01330 [Myxococcales bacterium]|nr:hypothetical protein [Myxococcales bacterium]